MWCCIILIDSDFFMLTYYKTKIRVYISCKLIVSSEISFRWNETNVRGIGTFHLRVISTFSHAALPRRRHRIRPPEDAGCQARPTLTLGFADSLEPAASESVSPPGQAGFARTSSFHLGRPEGNRGSEGASLFSLWRWAPSRISIAFAKSSSDVITAL